MKRTVGVIIALLLGFAVSYFMIYRGQTRLREQVIRVRSGDVTLEGTLYSGRDARQKFPTVLVLHGSGSDGRSNPYYRRLAETFSRAGYATFVYDKRGSGNSTGNWLAVPFQRLIDDAVSVAAHLKAMPEVDPDRIVIWGGSEGATIAPEVAVRSQASGVMAQSASGVPFWQQNRFQNVRALRLRGLDDAAIQRELVVHEAAMNYARTGQGWERFARLRADGSQLGITNPEDDIWWDWYGTKLDYDPKPWLRRLRVPILAIWGSEDALVPVADSRKAFADALAENKSATTQVIGGADHGLAVNGNLVHLETYATWLRERPVP